MKWILTLPASRPEGDLACGKRLFLLAATIAAFLFISPATTSAHINSLVPSSTLAGGPEFTLRILGTDFDESDTERLLFNGTRVAATLISSQELRATIPASLIVTAGVVRVTLEGFNSVDFTINATSSCSYLMSIGQGVNQLISQIFPADGGTGTINITAISGCAWGALLIQGDPFVSLTSASSESAEVPQGAGAATGTGRGILGYSVARNTGVGRRSAIIRLYRRDFSGTLDAEPFTVIQEGTRCPASAYNIAPLNKVRGYDAGSDSFQITAPRDCAWTASSEQRWIDVRTYTAFGSETIHFDVRSHEGPPRSGTISVAGKEFFVFQMPSDCFIRTLCAYFPSMCPGLGEGTLAASRRFRDDVLARTQRGQRYTNLYYQFSTEVVGIMMVNPMLMLRSRDILERYRPVLDSMIKGEQVTFTRGDLEEIDGFLSAFASKGTLQLQETIKGLCDDLRDPQVHREFNISVTEGPSRYLRSQGSVKGAQQRNMLTMFFGVALGGVFLGRFRRRRGEVRRTVRNALLCVALAPMLGLYGRTAVAAPKTHARMEPTVGAMRVSALPGNPDVGSWSTRAIASSVPFPARSRCDGGPRLQENTDHLQLSADPRLTFSTYFGRGGNEEGNSIAVDAAGNIYVTGFTDSLNFPLVNASQPNFGGGQQDAFVAKLDPSGTRVIYSTYIGGNAQDNATAITVDSVGNAYITGFTDSTNFPVRNALQPLKAGAFNAFVVKLDSTGAVVFSTLLGGTVSDYGSGIAVDPAGNIYVAGIATSPDFPTAGAAQQTFGGLVDAYVAKIDSSGTRLVYSTYLGGVGIEGASSIVVDSAGNLYLTGLTSSPNFRTVNARQPTHGGGLFDAFVTKLNPTGTQIIYSTYLGGGGEDRAFRIAVDSAGSSYVTGDTDSSDFPLANAAQSSKGGSADAFVAKLNPSGSQLVYSTYLGGSGIDGGTAIAIDTSGGAYVTGFTASTDFPTANSVQQVFGGSYDGFITKLSSSGSALEHSTYLGGSGIDSGFGVATDASGSAYVMGVTDSTNFPTAAPFQPAYGGGTADLFIARITAGLRIVDAIVDGKKLFVNGSGFDNGAKILIDGEVQKTANDSQNPAGALVAKKSGKKIKRGETATLQVRNSDGTLSNEFVFTRP